MDFKHNLSSENCPAFLQEISDKELSIIAHAKRFVERYTADPVFRELVAHDPGKAASKYHININAEDIRPLWDQETRIAHAEKGVPANSTLDLCRRYNDAMVGWMRRQRSGESLANQKYRAWWQRQVARNNSEIGAAINSKDVHAPVCIELSAGCTVGCWFCAISAERFQGAFEYTPENKHLWLETLETIRDIVGPAAEVGFCYWATDPFDNPDYEEFIKDYHAIICSMPVTTTAQAHKDIPRSKSLLNLWTKHKFVYNQLSILTIKILDRIHEEFSAEELVWTRLCLLNKGSIVKKAHAGRALKKSKKLAARGEDTKEILDELTQGTIACVSGFLINMVEKKVKLITPCKASDQWPDGYKIYDEDVFTSGANLKSIMERMIDNHMPMSMSEDNIIRFRRGLCYKPLANGFELSSEFTTQRAQNNRYNRQLGDLIDKGSYTVDTVVKKVTGSGVPAQEILASIDVMFKHGMLDDEPAAIRSESKDSVVTLTKNDLN